MKFFKENSYNILRLGATQVCLAILSLVMTMATHRNNDLYLGTSIFCTLFYIYLLYILVYESGQKDKPAIDGGRADLNPLKGLWISLAANAVNIICGIMIAIFSCFIVMQSPVAVVAPDGGDMTVYASIARPVEIDGETQPMNKDDLYEVSLFSDKGGEVRTEEYDGSKYCEVIANDGSVMYLYDSEGEELEFYGDSMMKLSTKRTSVKTWASNLYGIPYMIATFFQSMYAGIRESVFGANDSMFYLLTPIPPVVFCALAYYMGAKGKRLLFFLPQAKQKPPKR